MVTIQTSVVYKAVSTNCICDADYSAAVINCCCCSRMLNILRIGTAESNICWTGDAWCSSVANRDQLVTGRYIATAIYCCPCTIEVIAACATIGLVRAVGKGDRCNSATCVRCCCLTKCIVCVRVLICKTVDCNACWTRHYWTNGIDYRYCLYARCAITASVNCLPGSVY